MDGHNGNTKRIELSGGHWAVVRTSPATTTADLKAIQLAKLRDGRGFDTILDTIATFPTRISEWSYGPVDQANIDGVPAEDTMLLVREMLGIEQEAKDELPPLESSSAGTEAKKVRRSRGSGASGE